MAYTPNSVGTGREKTADPLAPASTVERKPSKPGFVWHFGKWPTRGGRPATILETALSVTATAGFAAVVWRGIIATPGPVLLVYSVLTGTLIFAVKLETWWSK